MQISDIVSVNGERGAIRDIEDDGSMIVVEMTDKSRRWFYFDDMAGCWREVDKVWITNGTVDWAFPEGSPVRIEF